MAGRSGVATPVAPEGWVDRHGDVMFRYALRWLRSSEIAEELVQDAFLEALRMRGTYRGRSSERTWLVGILRHKILDHIRRYYTSFIARPAAASAAKRKP
jgi:RNA polymerase sigma-70 factor (ECF subfamily)